MIILECENDGIREKTTTRSYEKLWTCRKRVWLQNDKISTNYRKIWNSLERHKKFLEKVGRTSDCFNKLAEAGHLELTMDGDDC